MIKYFPGLIFLVLLSVGCNTRRVVQVNPQTEFEQLDTLVITAQRTNSTRSEEDVSLPVYHPSATRTQDLLHTELDLRFDWENETVLGEALLRLQPYFNPVSSLQLDAKDFTIHFIRLEPSGTTLNHTYDGKILTIQLDRTYNKEEAYEIRIGYTARPTQTGGSEAITSDQGLFFINPQGRLSDKPMQIWTQGETEFNSRWFPTIDKPNERCTQVTRLTVQDRFKTLSNGLMVNSIRNADGTRTDTWEMNQPHAPYLFMLTIGEFAMVSEDWQGIPLEYYVEPKYEAHAREIFRHTPEMMTFFSEKLQLKYPWQKYAQVVVRDFVSGAMENTTSVIYGEFMQGTQRELVDNIDNEKIVAHELFHHWFGNLVTCESWANLTLNEGFANYSEYLWLEHFYGKDEADFHLQLERNGYVMASGFEMHPLIHYQYADKEDMFDRHSYNKGGLVLHMLRSYLGDDVFWASLNKYLIDNAYSDVEADELRLAFEDVSGEDLNWFFDQWFFSEGHPIIEVQSNFEKGQLKVQIEQLQNPDRMPPIFQFPTTIDLYDAQGNRTRKEVWVDQRKQVFTFDVKEAPALVNFDGDYTLLCERVSNKSEEEYLLQYYFSDSYSDRAEALGHMEFSNHPKTSQLFVDALQDPFWQLRIVAVQNCPDDLVTLDALAQLAKTDPHSQVRIAAMKKLAVEGGKRYLALAEKMALEDPSLGGQLVGLDAVMSMDDQAALRVAGHLEEDKDVLIQMTLEDIYAVSGDPVYLSYFEKGWAYKDGFELIRLVSGYSELAEKASPERLLTSARLLETIALNGNDSTVRRLAATTTINDLHGIVLKKGNKNIDNQLIKIIEKIKTTEKDQELLEIYSAFPDPPAKP